MLKSLLRKLKTNHLKRFLKKNPKRSQMTNPRRNLMKSQKLKRKERIFILSPLMVKSIKYPLRNSSKAIAVILTIQRKLRKLLNTEEVLKPQFNRPSKRYIRLSNFDSSTLTPHLPQCRSGMENGMNLRTIPIGIA